MDFAVHPPKQRKRKSMVYDPEPIPEPELDKLDNTIPKVLVRRTVEKTVTEREAEILCRNGWELVDPEWEDEWDEEDWKQEDEDNFKRMVGIPPYAH